MLSSLPQNRVFTILSVPFVLFLLLTHQISAGEAHDHDSVSEYEKYCGPRSLWIAGGRTGVSLSFDKLVTNWPIADKGTSFSDIKRVAEAHHLQAEGFHFDWEDLLLQNCPVIVFVNGNHFSVIDPRETLSTPDNGICLRYYDPPNPTIWITKASLERIWKGESLTISGQEVSDRALRFQESLV